MNTSNTTWSLVAASAHRADAGHVEPSARAWRPWGTYVASAPDVVTFVAPCPVSAEHPAEWTETREDTRTRADWWCPVCEVRVDTSATDGEVAS